MEGNRIKKKSERERDKKRKSIINIHLNIHVAFINIYICDITSVNEMFCHVKDLTILKNYFGRLKFKKIKIREFPM